MGGAINHVCDAPWKAYLKSIFGVRWVKREYSTYSCQLKQSHMTFSKYFVIFSDFI